MMHKGRKVVITLGSVAVGLACIGKITKPSTIYETDVSQKNPMEGKRVIFIPCKDEAENADGERGHLEAVGSIEIETSEYDRVWKRLLDVVLSFCGLVTLSPVLLGLAIAIAVDDPGPVMFTQKRVGRNKQYFRLHKFRSMKMCTPHDVPTHMLDNPEQYITKVGKFIRLHSLDELPQIWDIFIGSMSIIGPRPGLWNQDCLVAWRDKYGANDVRPGLTGWAQINGRDELEIPEKAKLDGDYSRQLKKGGLDAFLFDCRCFIGTVYSAARGDGVVEGGTGTKLKDEINKESEQDGVLVDK